MYTQADQKTPQGRSPKISKGGAHAQEAPRPAVTIVWLCSTKRRPTRSGSHTSCQFASQKGNSGMTSASSLYRTLLRLQRRWPAEADRPGRNIKDALAKEVRLQFRQVGTFPKRQNIGGAYFLFYFRTPM